MPFNFGKPGKQTASPSKPDGAQFLAEAKENLAELFGRYVQSHQEYHSLEEFVEALQGDTWTLFEQTCKTSYKNGLQSARNRKAA